jgi:hypothetical protein
MTFLTLDAITAFEKKLDVLLNKPHFFIKGVTKWDYTLKDNELYLIYLMKLRNRIKKSKKLFYFSAINFEFYEKNDLKNLSNVLALYPSREYFLLVKIPLESFENHSGGITHIAHWFPIILSDEFLFVFYSTAENKDDEAMYGETIRKFLSSYLVKNQKILYLHTPFQNSLIGCSWLGLEQIFRLSNTQNILPQIFDSYKNIREAEDYQEKDSPNLYYWSTDEEEMVDCLYPLFYSTQNKNTFEDIAKQANKAKNYKFLKITQKRNTIGEQIFLHGYAAYHPQDKAKIGPPSFNSEPFVANNTPFTQPFSIYASPQPPRNYSGYYFIVKYAREMLHFLRINNKAALINIVNNCRLSPNKIDDPYFQGLIQSLTPVELSDEEWLLPDTDYF